MAGEIAKATGRQAVPVAPPSLATLPTEVQAEVREQYQRTLDAKMSYVRMLAASSLLPAQYRRQPANVLWALEYGEALGISPVAAMMGVYVIDGRPAASAGLISGLVRKAGHRLRVSGNGESATCKIIRSDDPDYTFTATWTMDRARTAGLLGKDTWKKYPADMLRNRATTECARAACMDVLYGLGYTPEELDHDDLETTIAGTVLPDETEPPGEPSAGPAQVPAEPKASGRLIVALRDAYEALGIDEDQRIRLSGVIIGRPVTKPRDLTMSEAERLIRELGECRTADGQPDTDAFWELVRVAEEGTFTDGDVHGDVPPDGV